jgi:hypothetical protein
MDTSPFHQIASVTAGSDYILNIVWDGGSTMAVDMQGIIREGTAFAPLKDRDLFATVRIGEYRQSIEWPDPINRTEIMVDYHADSLYRRGEDQHRTSLTHRFITEVRRILRGSASQQAPEGR